MKSTWENGDDGSNGEQCKTKACSMNCAYCQNIVLKLFNQLVENSAEIVVWNKENPIVEVK